MKNILLITFVITSLGLTAQMHLIGLKGGVNFANISATNFSKSMANPLGLSGGVTYDYLINSYLSVGIDVLYQQRGFQSNSIFTNDEGEQIGTSLKSQFNYDYVTVPIKIGFNYGEKLYVFGNVGVTPALLIRAVTTIPPFEIAEIKMKGQRVNSTRNVNQFDIGAFLEIGVGYKLNNRYWIYASGTLNHSVIAFNNANYFPASNLKHRSISAYLGVKYRIGN